MITELAGLPPQTTGFHIAGRVSATDYHDVVIPVVAEAVRTGVTRFLVEMESFDGMALEALREDLVMGIEHFSDFTRIALVTDIPWVHHLADLFAWLKPGDFKYFPLDGRDEAVAWLSA